MVLRCPNCDALLTLPALPADSEGQSMRCTALQDCLSRRLFPTDASTRAGERRDAPQEGRTPPDALTVVRLGV